MSRTTALANLQKAHTTRQHTTRRRLDHTRQMAAEGAARHEIAATLGITQAWFGDWIRANDPDLARQLPRASRAAQDRINEIRWLADTGETLHSIAARLGIQPASLERRLHRHGETELLTQLRNRP